MKLRSLTTEGIERFADYLSDARAGSHVEPPFSMLSDPYFTLDWPRDVDVDDVISFADRFNCAQYLDTLFVEAGPEADQDVGVWTWLSLLYFEQLCPKRADGGRKILEQARYMPVLNNYRKYYRHLLYGPFVIYRAHRDAPDRARVVLTGPVHAPGEVAEQLLAGQERVTNRAVLEAASDLYLGRGKNVLKSGAAGKGPGSARRLVDYLNQLDRTYDLYQLSGAELLAMLPHEFDRFRPGS